MENNKNSFKSNVVELPVRKSSGADSAISQEAVDSYTENNYTEATRLCDRYLNAILPITTRTVLNFLIHRTLRYHKTEDCVSLSQIQNGVFSKKDEFIQSGTDISKNSILKGIRILASLGVVSCVQRSSKQFGKMANGYILNHKQIFVLAKKVSTFSRVEVKEMKLKISKKYNEDQQKKLPPSSKCAHTLVQNVTYPSSKCCHTQSGSNSQIDNSQIPVSANASTETKFSDKQQNLVEPNNELVSCKDKITEVIENVRNTSAAKRGEKAKRLSQSGVKALWVQISTRLCPTQVVMGVSPAKLSRIVNFLADPRNGIASPADFFEWVISTWPSFAQNRLEGWKSRRGESLTPYPDLTYFSIFLGWFKREYAKVQVEHGNVVLPNLLRDMTAQEMKIKHLEAKIEKMKKDQESPKPTLEGRYWE